jgi:hypothetical protein
MGTDAQHRDWMRQWRAAATALAEERRHRLRAMTDDEARAAASALLDLAEGVPLPPGRVIHSGLVEQQAAFHHRRPR